MGYSSKSGKLAGRGVGLDVFRPWPVRQHELNSQGRVPTNAWRQFSRFGPVGRSGSGDPSRAALRPPASAPPLKSQHQGQQFAVAHIEVAFGWRWLKKGHGCNFW